MFYSLLELLKKKKHPTFCSIKFNFWYRALRPHVFPKGLSPSRAELRALDDLRFGATAITAGTEEPRGMWRDTMTPPEGVPLKSEADHLPLSSKKGDFLKFLLEKTNLLKGSDNWWFLPNKIPTRRWGEGALGKHPSSTKICRKLTLPSWPASQFQTKVECHWGKSPTLRPPPLTTARPGLWGMTRGQTPKALGLTQLDDKLVCPSINSV